MSREKAPILKPQPWLFLTLLGAALLGVLALVVLWPPNKTRMSPHASEVETSAPPVGQGPNGLTASTNGTSEESAGLATDENADVGDAAVGYASVASRLTSSVGAGLDVEGDGGMPDATRPGVDTASPTPVDGAPMASDAADESKAPAKAPAITASLLLSVDGTDPRSAWTGLSPTVRPSDVVIARVDGDATSLSWLGFSDVIALDAPLVQYVIAFSDVARLDAMLARGIPSSASAVGLTSADGLDADGLAALSASVRGAGKRLFISVDSNPTATMPVIGQRADIVELVSQGSSVAALTGAINALRTSGRPTIFVRISSGASTQELATFSQQLGADIGFSLPPGSGTTAVTALRPTNAH